MSAACEDNYVVSCNPPEKTPVSEVVVVRTDEPEHMLAPTGGEIAGGLIAFAVFLAVVGAVGAFGRRKR